jgi:uroporphyrinogen decarboxylase
MKTLTERERILRTYRHQEVDRIPMLDSAWEGTVRRWQNEGLPKDVSWVDYFGFDHQIRVGTDNSPRFAKKVLEENDRYKIVTTQWGTTQKVFRELDSTPENLNYYFDSSDRWEEAKKAMLTFHEDRIPWDYLKNNYPRWKAEGRFLQLTVWFGFDVAHSHMIGTENFLVSMLDEPEWVTDVFDTYLKTSLDLCQRILDAGYEFDGVFWYDDMGYKGTPFFSPQTYRELLQPYHKTVVDWAHERGMVTELHSCGFIEPLLPDVVQTGVEMLNPLEIKAGMNPQRLKSTYGDKLAFHGGINAQLWDNIDRVKAEMERIIPLMKEGGGYVFASDHSIPNSVSFENMKEIAALAHKLGKY